MLSPLGYRLYSKLMKRDNRRPQRRIIRALLKMYSLIQMIIGIMLMCVRDFEKDYSWHTGPGLHNSGDFASPCVHMRTFLSITQLMLTREPKAHSSFHGPRFPQRLSSTCLSLGCSHVVRTLRRFSQPRAAVPIKD